MFGNNRPNPELALQKQGLDINKESAVLEYDSSLDQYRMQQQEEKNDLTKLQQDLEKQIEVLKHILRRDCKVNNVWVQKKDTVPMMNEEGIAMVEGILYPCTSVNLMMSNYDEQKIYAALRGTVLDFIDTLQFNYIAYEIAKGDLTSIVRLFRSFIEPTHWRCLNNGERKFLTTVNRRIETFSDRQDAGKNKNILGGFM